MGAKAVLDVLALCDADWPGGVGEVPSSCGEEIWIRSRLDEIPAAIHGLIGVRRDDALVGVSLHVQDGGLSWRQLCLGGISLGMCHLCSFVPLIAGGLLGYLSLPFLEEFSDIPFIPYVDVGVERAVGFEVFQCCEDPVDTELVVRAHLAVGFLLRHHEDVVGSAGRSLPEFVRWRGREVNELAAGALLSLW